MCLRIRSKWIDLVHALLRLLYDLIELRIHYAFSFVKAVVLVTRLIENLIHLLYLQIDHEIQVHTVLLKRLVAELTVLGFTKYLREFHQLLRGLYDDFLFLFGLR